MSLTTTIDLALLAIHTSALDLATGTVPLNYSKRLSLASGTGANQADLIWHDQRSIAASSSDNLDIAGGLTDAFGATVTFARIRAMVVRADANNAGRLQVGSAPANAWLGWLDNGNAAVQVRPGGLLLLTGPDSSGYPVAAGTGDRLLITNTAASVAAYDIVLIGASA